MEYETRIIKIVVAPKGDPIYSERATTIEIDDLAGGEFVKIAQNRGSKECECIAFDREEWQAVKTEIDRMVLQCRDYLVNDNEQKTMPSQPLQNQSQTSTTRSNHGRKDR